MKKLLFFLIILILILMFPINVNAFLYCLNNNTLIKTGIFYINNETINSTEAIHCEFGCEENACIPSPLMQFLIFIGIVVAIIIIIILVKKAGLIK